MAGLTIPDAAEVPQTHPSYQRLAVLDQTHIDVMRDISQLHGVVKGQGGEMAVTWDNANQEFDVASGMTVHYGVFKSYAGGSIAIPAADADPRKDAIVLTSGGALAIRQGVADASVARLPALTAGDVLLAYYLRNGDAPSADHLEDGRPIIELALPSMSTTLRDAMPTAPAPGFMFQNTTTGGMQINVPSLGAPTTPRWFGLKEYNYFSFFPGTMITGSSVSGDRLYLRANDSDNGIVTVRAADVTSGTGNAFILGAFTIETAYAGVPADASGRKLFALGANATASDMYMYPALDGGRVGWQAFLAPKIFGTGTNTTYASGKDVQLSHRMFFMSAHGWGDTSGSHAASPQQHLSFYAVSYDFTSKTTTTAAISSAGSAGDSVTVAVTTPGNLTVNNPYLMVDAGIAPGTVALTPAGHPEIMLCTAINGSDVTFQRGWLGSRNYTHASGSQIYLITTEGTDRKFFQIPHGLDTDGYTVNFLRVAMTADVEMTGGRVLGFNRQAVGTSELSFGGRAGAAGLQANSANDNVVETLPGGLSLPMPTTGTALRISGGAGSHACTLDGTLWYNTTQDALELRGGFAPDTIDTPAWNDADTDGPYGISLFPAVKTFASVAGNGSGWRGFYMTTAISLGFTTQGNNSATMMAFAPTVTHTTATSAFGHFAGIAMSPIVRNSGNVAFGPYLGFLDTPTVQINDNNTLTMGLHYSFYSVPTFGRGGGSSTGTITITNERQFAAIGPVVGAGATVATRVGLYITRPSGAGVVTTDIGIYNESPTQYKPSAAQAITLASNTILANASVVQVNTTGSITLTSTPTIANGQDGQELEIVNTTNGSVLTLQDESGAAGTNLRLNAATIALAYRDVLRLRYNAAIGDWVQICPVSNNL